MDFHDYANIFPMMTPAEHAGLVENMRAHGYDKETPIILHEGKILDGRNRFRAAQEAGVTPAFKTFAGTNEAALHFVMRHNLERRHLNASQRAMVGVSVLPHFEALAKARMESGINQHSPKEKIPEGSGKQARDEAAAVVGANPRYVSDAKAISEQAPEVAAAVMAGQMNIPEAKKVAALPEEQRAAVVEKVKAGESAKDAIKAAKKESKEKLNEEMSGIPDSAQHKEIEVKAGQWWKLGRHKLYCGDTSKPDFYENLSGELGFADPPYGAGVSGFDDSKFYWEHDWLENTCGVVCVTPGIVSIFEFARKTQMNYKWSHATWIKNGMTRGALGFGNWIYTAIFSKNKSIHRNAQDFNSINIETSSTNETSHKGRKPLQYISEIIGLFTSKGDTVVDPFLGSGQTIMACEKMNRVCVGGEIMPEHCTAIISRWEAMTGEKAVLL